MSALIHSLEQSHRLQGPVKIENVGPLFKKHEEFQDDNSRVLTPAQRVLCMACPIRKRLEESVSARTLACGPTWSVCLVPTPLLKFLVFFSTPGAPSSHL